MSGYSSSLRRIPSRWELKQVDENVENVETVGRIPSRWELKPFSKDNGFTGDFGRIPSRWELKPSLFYSARQW